MNFFSAVVEWILEFFGYLWAIAWWVALAFMPGSGCQHHHITRQEWENFLWFISFRQLPRSRRQRSDRANAAKHSQISRSRSPKSRHQD